jgi:hypothetical protein
MDRTPEENNEFVEEMAASVGIPLAGTDVHGKDSPEGFVFITNISNPPGENSYMDFESEAEFLARLQTELGDDLALTTPAYDAQGKPWDGTALHVRSGVKFTMLKPKGE